MKNNAIIESLCPIYVENHQLSIVSKAKSLGIYINSKLSAIDHVNSVVSRIYFVLRNLRMSSHYTPLETRLKLVKQLILPIITYFDNIYCKLDSISLHKLLVAFNHATRYVYNLSRFEHISNWSKSILGCDLATFLILKNLTFLHRLIKYKTPEYLYEH